MGDAKENEAYEEELLDYEEEDEKAPDSVNAKVNGESGKKWVPPGSWILRAHLLN